MSRVAAVSRRIAQRGVTLPEIAIAVVVLVGGIALVLWRVQKTDSLPQVEKRAEPRSTASPGSAPPLPAAAPDAATAPPRAPRESIDGVLGRADTLGKVVRRHGCSASAADEVLRAIAGTLDARTLQAGQPYHLERDADGRVQIFELTVDAVTTVHVERDAQGALITTKIAPARPTGDARQNAD